MNLRKLSELTDRIIRAKEIPMHNVFISFHHGLDEIYKIALQTYARQKDVFIDCSVDTGDINENLPDETICEIIRDEYLRDSTVTILLVGEETKNRKHMDWELYSSMYDGKINKKSGIIVVLLPTTHSQLSIPAHEGELKNVFDGHQTLSLPINEEEWLDSCEYLPDRIIDNLLKDDVYISVIPWRMIMADTTGYKLKYMIDCAFKDKRKCKYNLSRKMRRRNS